LCATCINGFFNNVAQQFVVGTRGNTIYILLQLTRCIPLVTINYKGLTGEGVVVPWRKVHGKALNDNEVALQILQISHQNKFNIEPDSFAALPIASCTKQ